MVDAVTQGGLTDISKKSWLFLILSGLATGASWLCYYRALQIGEASKVVPIDKLSVVITLVLAFVFLHERFTPKSLIGCLLIGAGTLLFHEKMTRAQVLCFLMSTLGVALIIGSGSVHGGASDVRGICFGVSAAVFYAAVILLNKYITGVPALERTFVQFLAAILVLAPYVALTSGFHPEVLSATGWVNLLIVGFVHTGVTYCIYFSAIRTLPGQESSLLSYLDPIVSVLISVLLLGEPLAPIQIAGMVLFLGFAIANEFTHKNAETT